MARRSYITSYLRQLEREERRRQALRAKQEKARRKYEIAMEKERAIEYAKKMTNEYEEERNEISNLLKLDINKKIKFNWEDYKDKEEYKENLVKIDLPIKPNENKYKIKFSLLNLIVPGRKGRIEKEMKSKKENDLIKWNKECENINIINKENEDEFEKNKLEFEKSQLENNNKISRLENENNEGKKDGVEFYFNEILSKIKYPNYFSDLIWELNYNEENRILVIDYSLPKKSDVNNIKQVKYVQTRKEFTETYIKDSEINKIYEDGLYQFCLKINKDIYLNDNFNNISSVVFNGFLTDINKRNGKEETQCILSLQTEKEKFMDLNLSLVDSRECFKSLKGVSGSKLHELVPVAPIIDFDKDDKRFIESKEIGNKISGYNLAAMHWEDFEHLIRELFEKEFANNGSEIKVTQASRDGGVDAIMFDPDPIKGGKYIIQAKRYTGVVGVSAVRDLYGTVLNEGASKGILVTTSDYGLDSYNFAKDKPITLLNGSNLLHMLEKHGYEARIDLKEAKIELNKNN